MAAGGNECAAAGPGVGRCGAVQHRASARSSSSRAGGGRRVATSKLSHKTVWDVLLPVSFLIVGKSYKNGI